MKQNIYWQVLLELVDDMEKALSESIGKIAIVLQILIPVLIGIADATTWERIALSAGWTFIVVYMKRADLKLNRKEKGGFPLPPCKLTKTDKNGFVDIVEGMEEIAIIYLSDLEEYIERKNLFSIDLHAKV